MSRNTQRLGLVAVAANAQLFSLSVLKRPLRPYQLPPLLSIVQACLHPHGQSIVIRFPRQSGKNELLAHCELYLLFLFQRRGGALIHVAPTFKPQAQNAQRRARALGRAPLLNLRKFDNQLSIRDALISYTSGKEREHPYVGPTADICLIVNEAQDIERDYFERAFSPMTISTDAPTVYAGTARHDETLLAVNEAETTYKHIIDWRDVARHLPAYGRAVERRIERLGAQHPIIITEYENKSVARIGNLFDDRRRALMEGPHARMSKPKFGEQYVATLDVGGTSLLHSDTLHDPTVCAIQRVSGSPTKFETVDYFTLEHGENVLDDTPDRARLFAYLELWKPRRIVIDATGLGVGLASALQNRFGDAVLVVVITALVKTRLLNDYLALVETGRYKHYAPPTEGAVDVDRERFFAQMGKCKHEYNGAHIVWGVGASVEWTHPLTGKSESLHDDHLLSDSMCGLLANESFAPRTVTAHTRDESEIDDPLKAPSRKR